MKQRIDGIADITIREATIHDIDTITNLWLAMVNEVVGNEARPDCERFREFLRRNLSVETKSQYQYVCYIANYAGEIIGFIDGQLIYDFIYGKNLGYGHHFYIKPEYRHYVSIGFRLLRNIIRKCLKHNVYEICLVTWECKLKQWQRFGFKIDRYILRKRIQRL